MVNGGKVLGNFGVIVEAVDNMEVCGKCGRLRRQIGGTSATEDHHINGICHFSGAIGGKHGDAFCLNGQRIGIAPCKDSSKRHITVLPNCRFHAAAEIAITENTDTNAHVIYLSAGVSRTQKILSNFTTGKRFLQRLCTKKSKTIHLMRRESARKI